MRPATKLKKSSCKTLLPFSYIDFDHDFSIAGSAMIMEDRVAPSFIKVSLPKTIGKCLMHCGSCFATPN